LAQILWIGIGNLNIRLQLPRSKSIIGKFRPESTLCQIDFVLSSRVRHALTKVSIATLSKIQAWSFFSQLAWNQIMNLLVMAQR
jgi:hypothetical protein